MVLGFTTSVCDSSRTLGSRWFGRTAARDAGRDLIDQLLVDRHARGGTDRVLHVCLQLY